VADRTLESAIDEISFCASPEQRQCNYCGCSHPLTGEFWYSHGPNKTPQCRVAEKAKAAARYLINKEKISARNAKWKRNNKDKVLASARARNEKDPDKRIRNRVAFNQSRPNYYKEYIAKRKIECPSFRLRILMRNRLYSILARNNKVSKTSLLNRYLGCDEQELIAHIESQFTPEMTWENWGKVWHLDHIIPICLLDINNDLTLKAILCYTNLRPLSIQDNLRKSNLIGVDNG
jgi:hypothetical protein